MSQKVQSTVITTPIALDGGWAWIVLLGSFVAYFIADGWSYSFGVLFPNIVLQFEDGKGKTALIGALLYGMPLIVSPLVCALTNIYGCRIVAIIGGGVLGSSFIISFFANSVDFLCVTTGFIGSVGLAMTYIPAIVIVTFYFERRRGLATGLAVTGSGLGAFACPPLLELLIGHYSWRGSLLIFGAVCFNIIPAGALFRPPPMEKTIVESVDFLPTTHYKEYKYWLKHGIITPKVIRSKKLKNTHSNSDTQLQNKDVPLTLEPLHVHHASFKSPEEKILLKETKRMLEKYAHTTISCPDLYSLTKIDISDSSFVFSDASTVEYQKSNEELTGKIEDNRCGAKLRNEIMLIIKSMLDKSLAKNWCYLTFCAAAFILYMWIGIPYVYLIDKATLLGIDIEDAVFLLSIIGIGRTLGQILLGYLGDRKSVSGTLVYAISIIICGLSTGLVPFIVNYAGLSAYCAIFGFCVSVTYALQMMCIVDLVGIDKSTSAFGLFQLVQGIATLLGTPIAGWLYDETGDYNISFYCAGAWIVVSGLVVAPLPLMMKRQRQRTKTAAQHFSPNASTYDSFFEDSKSGTPSNTLYSDSRSKTSKSESRSKTSKADSLSKTSNFDSRSKTTKSASFKTSRSDSLSEVSKCDSRPKASTSKTYSKASEASFYSAKSAQ